MQIMHQLQKPKLLEHEENSDGCKKRNRKTSKISKTQTDVMAEKDAVDDIIAVREQLEKYRKMRKKFFLSP